MSVSDHESSTDLDEFIHGEVLIPTVLVIATERSRELIHDSNNLSISELLTPFGGYYTPISCQYRVLDKSIRQNGFKVKFVDTAHSYFKNDCDQLGQANFSLLHPSSTRSFEKWFSGYVQGLNWSESECLDQPIGTLLIVSSDDQNPMDCFEQLSHVANQPNAAKNGILDPTSARVKILLHDLQSGSDMRYPESIANQLRGIYSPQSVICLPINSNNSGETIPDIRALYNKHCLGTSPDAGRSLSWEDVDRLNEAIVTVVLENAIPWMERKLQLLDANITAKRKGLRNQLRNFLRSDQLGPKSATLQQVEWQCRLAGDLAFHLRHHELAFSYYRNVGSDFKTDRLLAQAAGCYEMSAISGFLAGHNSVGELSRFLDVAIDLYKDSKLGTHVIRAATIQSLILRGRTEAADKLIKWNGDVPDSGLRCAVLLSRAAYLFGAGGMKRKESFTTVLAGHMFNKVEGMKEWALQCYSDVLEGYPGWTYITDHLLFTMAKIEFNLSRFDKSVELLKRLMNGVVNSSIVGTVEKHVNYVKLITYVGKAIDGMLVDEMPIPVLSVGNVTDGEVFVKVKNPLLVNVDVSGMKILFSNLGGESEVSGLVVIEPGEMRSVGLQCVIDDGVEVVGVEYTLFNSMKCIVRL